MLTLVTGELSNADFPQLVDAATRELIAGRTDTIARLFTAIESPVPTTRWDPAAETLDSDRLRFLLEVWREGSSEGRLPSSRSIDPMRLAPALGYVMLLEPVDGAANGAANGATDFRYRVYGSIIAEHSGIEMTGKRVRDLPSAPVAVYLLATYRAVCLTRRPMFAHHTTHYDIQIAEWSRLILPFVADDGTVDRLLVGNVPSLRSA